MKRHSPVLPWVLLILASCTYVGFWLGGAMKMFLPWVFALLRQPLPIFDYNLLTIFGTALGVIVGLIWARGVLRNRY